MDFNELACYWTVGGNQSTWSKPKHMWRESNLHTESTLPCNEATTQSLFKKMFARPMQNGLQFNAVQRSKQAQKGQLLNWSLQSTPRYEGMSVAVVNYCYYY